MEQKTIDWKTFALKVIPCAAAVALDISLSNLSLKQITISFYTLVKATSSIFALMFGIVLGKQKINLENIGVVMFIVTGLSLASRGNHQFNATGFVLIFLATVMSGLRWSLLQVLLQDEPLLPTSFHVLKALAAPAGFLVLCSSLVLEMPWEGKFVDYLHRPNGILQAISLCLITGFLAVGLSVSSYMVLQRTNVIMFMAFGALKEILQICLSVLMYGDEVTYSFCIGIVLVLGGVFFYKYARYRRLEALRARLATYTNGDPTDPEMNLVEQTSLLKPDDSSSDPPSGKRLLGSSSSGRNQTSL